MTYTERANARRTPAWWAKVADLSGEDGLTLSQQRELLLDYEACAEQVQTLEALVFIPPSNTGR